MAQRQRPEDRRHASFKRTKHGCLTCRRRKKKCDEVKPRCAGCKRNDLQCCWTEGNESLETSPPGRADQALEQASPLFSSTACAMNGAYPLQDEVSSQASTLSPERSGPRFGASLLPEQASSHASNAQNALPSFGTDNPELQPTDGTGSTLLPNDDAELMWQPSVQCYLASTRPVLFTPNSTLFLQHYITTTGAMLPMPLTSNAFLDTLLPLACKDDMLMHSLLALGGAHLSCDRDRTVSSMQQIKDSMLRHYIWTIHQVRKELASFDTRDYVRTVRLILVLTLLCHVEVISGEKNSFTFQHLNASSQLVSNIIRDGLQKLQDCTEVGLVLELHSYIIITNKFTPQGMIPNRTLNNDNALAIVHTLSLYETCGVMYGGYQELFALIPQVSDIFSRRLAEEAAVSERQPPDLTRDADNLSRKLSAWHIDESVLGPASSVRARDQILIAEAIRHGIRIYLHAAMAGSTLPGAAAARSMRDSSDAIIGLIKTLDDQSWACNSLWTILMAGSCLTDAERRSNLTELLRNTRYRMDHLLRSIEVLEQLWDEPNPLSFGPYGICLVIQKHSPAFAII